MLFIASVCIVKIFLFRLGKQRPVQAPATGWQSIQMISEMKDTHLFAVHTAETV